VDFLADGGWAAVDPRLNVIRGSLSVESPAPAVPDMPSGWGLALGLGAMAAAARVRRT
jgi:MYXO-CTERM domain-containing protein